MLNGGGTFDDVQSMLAMEPDVTDVFVDGLTLYFTVAGLQSELHDGQAARLSPDADPGGAFTVRRAAPGAIGPIPAGQAAGSPPTGQRMVGEDRNGDGRRDVEKKAIVLSPYQFQFQATDDGQAVANLLSARADYAGRVDFHPVPVKGDAILPMSVWTSWASYDVIHVVTHGERNRLWLGDSTASCTALAATIRMQLPVTVDRIGIRCGSVNTAPANAAPVWDTDVSVDPSFFLWHYPDGLPKRFVFLNACRMSFAPGLAQSLLGHRGAGRRATVREGGGAGGGRRGWRARGGSGSVLCQKLLVRLVGHGPAEGETEPVLSHLQDDVDGRGAGAERVAELVALGDDLEGLAGLDDDRSDWRGAPELVSLPGSGLAQPTPRGRGKREDVAEGGRPRRRDVQHTTVHRRVVGAFAARPYRDVGALGDEFEELLLWLPRLALQQKHEPLDRAGRHVRDEHVLDSVGERESRDGASGGTQAYLPQAGFAEVEPGQPARVDDGGERRGSRSVLVIVEDRLVELGEELLLDEEAIGCPDVLQVDGAEAERDTKDRLDELLRTKGVDEDRIEGLQKIDAVQMPDNLDKPPCVLLVRGLDGDVANGVALTEAHRGDLSEESSLLRDRGGQSRELPGRWRRRTRKMVSMLSLPTPSVVPADRYRFTRGVHVALPFPRFGRPGIPFPASTPTALNSAFARRAPHSSVSARISSSTCRLASRLSNCPTSLSSPSDTVSGCGGQPAM